MHRFYLPPERCAGTTLRLDGREAHHALRVLRVERGERVAVLDGAGHEFFCEVQNSARDMVELRVTKTNFIPPPPCQVTLLQALPRGKIIESIIQKSVELGAYHIVPLVTERVVTDLDEAGAEHKREKWQQLAIEASKQCGAAWLPKIATPTTIEKFLAAGRSGGRQTAGAVEAIEKGGALPKAAPPACFELSLVGSLQTARRHPREIFREFEKARGHLPKSVAVWIGPEGDFTPEELKAVEAAGARPITLGNLTLRVETAAVYCLSVLNYELSR